MQRALKGTMLAPQQNREAVRGLFPEFITTLPSSGEGGSVLKAWPSLILSVVVAACHAAPERVSELDLSQARDSLRAVVDGGRLPGAALLVGVGEAPVQTVTVGFSDLESRRPLTDSSIFRLASTTKIWTAVTLMTLVEDGQLDLADPISRYLPEFANRKFFLPDGETVPVPAEATILDLLRHTGGDGVWSPGLQC